MKRIDNRASDELRPIEIKKNYLPHAEGSALIRVGNTKVICTASVEEQVPAWLAESGKGWITAEYSMLPRATHKRSRREVSRGKPGGRTQEIQRLIGRALRSVVNLQALPDLTVYIDADVIRADGGTRTAAITGSFVALYDAFRHLKERGKIEVIPVNEIVAATSVGIMNNEIILDLNYEEDSNADVDMNIIMTESSKFVEVQGTAEKEAFSKEQLDKMISLASKGIKDIIDIQKKVLEIN